MFNSKLSKKLYNGKYQFIACDGSAVDIFRNPNDPDTFSEPNGKSLRGFNQIHINAFYSILDRRFTNLVMQPGRKRNEYSAFCEMVDAADNDGPPTIYFADMGYASYNNFAHVIENGQFFLIRCNDTIGEDSPLKRSFLPTSFSRAYQLVNVQQNPVSPTVLRGELTSINIYWHL